MRQATANIFTMYSKSKSTGELNRNIAHVQISDDGIVEIAEGVSQIVKKLSVNGVELPPGIYGGEEASGVTDASYAKHFAGKGTLRVYASMMLIVR